MRIADSESFMRTIQRHCEQQQAIIASSTARIATGSRLVGAVDDAAGVAIAQRVRSQFESMRQASRNAQEGVNFVHVAQSTLTHSVDLVQRMRVMALQSANGTYSDDQRAYLQRSVVLTLDELDALARRVAAGDVNLLDGARGSLRVQAGPGAGDTIEVASRDADHEALGLGALSVATQTDAVSALDRLDEAITLLNEHRAEMAAARARMERMVDSLGAGEEVARASHARINDVDIAGETVRMLRAQIASDAGAAMMVQVRQATQLVLNLLLPQESSGSDSEPVGGRSGASDAAVGAGVGTARVPPGPQPEAVAVAPRATVGSTNTHGGGSHEPGAEIGVSASASASVADGRWGARSMA